MAKIEMAMAMDTVDRTMTFESRKNLAMIHPWKPVSTIPITIAVAIPNHTFQPWISRRSVMK